MRKLIFILTLFVGILSFQEASAQVIGYYNSRDLLLALPDYQQAAEISKGAKLRRENQIKELEAELDQAKQQLVLDKPKLSETMYQLKEREIKDKAARIEQFKAASMQDIRKLEAELLVPIHNKMGKALETVILANNIDKHADLAKPEIQVKKGWVDLTPMLKKELGLVKK